MFPDANVRVRARRNFRAVEIAGRFGETPFHDAALIKPPYNEMHRLAAHATRVPLQARIGNYFRQAWRGSVGEDWRGADIGSVETETVITFLQRF